MIRDTTWADTTPVAGPAATSVPGHETIVPNVRVRRGSVSDWEGVRRLVEVVYGVPRSLESLHWLYEANPAGRCQLWVAEDATTGEIVACRPVFPWRMRIGERVMVVCQAGDAMTHPNFRRRGVFGALVKLAWAELCAQGVPFSFSFSMPGSLSVYKKIPAADGTGTREVLHFQRMTYLLSVRPLLERVPGLAGLRSAVEPLHRAVQQRRLRLPAGQSVFRVSRFGDEFDELWARTANHHGVLTVRDSRYLNWRFVDLPSGPFQVLGVRMHGALVGYVAFELDAQGNGWIADLFGRPEPAVVGALLRAGLAAMMEQGAVKASIWVATESPVAAMVRKFGFLPRDEPFPMAVHVYRAGSEAEAALDGARWWAWYGDRDAERLVTVPVSPPSEGQNLEAA